MSRVFNSLPAGSQEVIRDITLRMGKGMADYVSVGLGQGTVDMAATRATAMVRGWWARAHARLHCARAGKEHRGAGRLSGPSASPPPRAAARREPARRCRCGRCACGCAVPRVAGLVGGCERAARAYACLLTSPASWCRLGLATRWALPCRRRHHPRPRVTSRACLLAAGGLAPFRAHFELGELARPCVWRWQAAMPAFAQGPPGGRQGVGKACARARSIASTASSRTRAGA